MGGGKHNPGGGVADWLGISEMSNGGGDANMIGPSPLWVQLGTSSGSDGLIGGRFNYEKGRRRYDARPSRDLGMCVGRDRGKGGGADRWRVSVGRKVLALAAAGTVTVSARSQRPGVRRGGGVDLKGRWGLLWTPLQSEEGGDW